MWKYSDDEHIGDVLSFEGLTCDVHNDTIFIDGSAWYITEKSYRDWPAGNYKMYVRWLNGEKTGRYIGKCR